MNKNTILSAVIVIEIVLLALNHNEMVKEQIDDVYSKNSNTNINILTMFILTLLLSLIYTVAYFIQRKTRMNPFLLFLFVAIQVIVYIEYKLETNLKWTRTEDSLENALSKCKTGDFLFFRCYHSYDILGLLFYRYFYSMISDTYFGHIGMIVKIEDTPYILECTQDYHTCEYSGKYKSGVVLNKAYDRIKDYYGRIYLSRNNLHNYLTETDIHKCIQKYSNHSYLENNITCSDLMIKLLYECNLLKKEYSFIRISDFTHKDIYRIDYSVQENIKMTNLYVMENDTPQNERSLYFG